MRKGTGLLIFLLMAIGCIAQTSLPFTAVTPKYTAKQKVVHFTIGDKRIPVHLSSYGNYKQPVMVNLHHNERTSLEAARQVLAARGGILVHIENEGKRLIRFTMQGQSWKFDPNRMFTRHGIEADLMKHNKQVNSRVVREIEQFARFILRKIPNAPTLIALHNNDENNFSVLTYLGNGKYKDDARAVHTNEQHDPDNFFLTTDQTLYESLRKLGYNVILQHNKKATDDGSLSVYFGRRNKSYINVEAEEGRLQEQQDMIEQVVSRTARSRRNTTAGR